MKPDEQDGLKNQQITQDNDGESGLASEPTVNSDSSTSAGDATLSEPLNEMAGKVAEDAGSSPAQRVDPEMSESQFAEDLLASGLMTADQLQKNWNQYCRIVGSQLIRPTSTDSPRGG